MNCLILAFVCFLQFFGQNCLIITRFTETHLILVCQGLRRNRTTQPCFWGYPRKIKLTHDCIHGHLCTPMLQIHGAICAVSWWCLLLDLAVPACPICGLELSSFSPHDHLVYLRQYRVSRLICARTLAWSWRLLRASIALVWLCDWANTLVGNTTE